MTPSRYGQGADLGGIKILHLEDDPVDGRLVGELLAEGGIVAELERVDDLQAFKAAVDRGEHSLILSDYTIPGVDAFEALNYARLRRPDIPYIFVSGTLGEEHAVEALKQGATDYVLKQRLERLVPSVSRAVTELRDRRLRQEAERAMQESEIRFRAIFEHARDAIIVTGTQGEGRVVDANPAALELFGYNLDEFQMLNRDAMLDASAPGLSALLDTREKIAHASAELTYMRKDGSRFTGELTTAFLDDEDGHRRAVAIIRDVTERKLAEEALRAGEERLRRTQAIAHLGSWELDLVTERLFWSDEVYRIFGLEPQKSRASYEAFLKVVHPEDRTAVDAAYRASLLEGKESYELEHRIVRPDTGEVRYVHEKCEHVRDPSGRITRSLGMVHDVTERKLAEARVQELNASLEKRNAELESERMRWKGLVEGIAEEVWICDAQGRISLINLPDVTAMGLVEFEGRTIREVLDDVEILYGDGRVRPPEEAPLLRSLRTGEISRGDEIMRHRASGRERYRQYSCAPTRDASGAITGAIAIVRDVTESKRTEEALREADRRKSEFIAMLSHELRNPLSPIQNSLYILDRVPPGSEQARRALAAIGRQANHLTRLVGDILDVSRMTRGKIQLQREHLDLVEAIGRTVDDYRAVFSAANVDFTFEPPSHSLGANVDPTRLAQAVGNLVQNAAKFTPAGGHVHLRLAQEGASAVLTVRDTGVGISPELMSRLFEPFTQADRSLDRSSGGLGLGLSLVKGLVELHGGHVGVKSEGPGRGAEFTIRLPLESQPKGLRDSEPERTESRRVLIIEDNVDSAESLKESLELDGHEVAIAFTGPDGLAKAREFLPDVVLCDIGLPGMDGYAVAEAFRTDDRLRDLPLVALTGYAAKEDQECAARAGFDHHLSKPLKIGELTKILSRLPVRGSRAS